MWSHVEAKRNPKSSGMMRRLKFLLMLRCLSLSIFVAAIPMASLSLWVQASTAEQNDVYIECRGKKTQGSGLATGFSINHPVLVNYKLDQIASTLVETSIDVSELSAGTEPIPIQMYGKTLMARFRNRKLRKDYEIQIRGDDRLFSITVFPSSGFDPDAWYGQCVKTQSP